jgi:hypothetical protein
MTQDDIIRWAREAGLAQWHESIQQHGFTFAEPDRLERFAELVAASERETIIDIVALHGGSVEIEAAIRARGNDGPQ